MRATPRDVVRSYLPRPLLLEETDALVRVAGPTFPSATELRAYADREDLAFRSLESDMYRSLVWENPDVLRAREVTFRDLANDPPPGLDDAQAAKYTDAQNAVADSLEADADELERRANRAGVEKAGEQVLWSARYRDFMSRWHDFQTNTLENSWAQTLTHSAEWDTVDGFDAEFRQDYATYQKDLGYVPSAPLPPTPEQIAAAHVDPNAFQWSTLVYGAIAVSVAVVVWKVLP